MSDANKALASRFIEEFWHKGNFDIADEIMGLNFVNHNPVRGIPVDRDGYKEWAPSSARLSPTSKPSLRILSPMETGW